MLTAQTSVENSPTCPEIVTDVTEYGDEWHHGGSLANKQNVFNDFISAGEELIKLGYTSPNKLAIEGGSNGGLLVAACANQRPDLFGAVICEVGVLDMYRFHKFTIGHAWCTEFGNPDTAEDFSWMEKYSPLHTVPDTGPYPSTLLMTEGGSNGGLLVAACANQRPDLFGAVICEVGVLDMYRFHKFTIGHAWCTEFGNPDTAEDFSWMEKYSPLHTVPDTGPYPSTLLMTASRYGMEFRISSLNPKTAPFIKHLTVRASKLEGRETELHLSGIDITQGAERTCMRQNFVQLYVEHGGMTVMRNSRLTLCSCSARF
eukprot:sb/3466950/